MACFYVISRSVFSLGQKKVLRNGSKKWINLAPLIKRYVGFRQYDRLCFIGDVIFPYLCQKINTKVFPKKHVPKIVEDQRVDIEKLLRSEQEQWEKISASDAQPSNWFLSDMESKGAFKCLSSSLSSYAS